MGQSRLLLHDVAAVRLHAKGRVVHEAWKAMKAEPEKVAGSRGLSTHILKPSIVMIGVSSMLVGLIKVAKTHMPSSRADEYTAIATMIFLFGAVSSYLSIRHKDRAALSQRCEQVADLLFIVGLVCMALILVFFAYEII
jgi:hypothetical protein